MIMGQDLNLGASGLMRDSTFVLSITTPRDLDFTFGSRSTLSVERRNCV